MKTWETAAILAEQTLSFGQLTRTKGKVSVNDGEGLLYLITDPDDYMGPTVGLDNFYLKDNSSIAVVVTGQTRSISDGLEFWDGQTWNTVEVGKMCEPSNNTDIPYEYPYSFFFPQNETDESEMLANAAGNSIGYGGSVWWSRPCAVGRKENGADVIYRGDTYGSSEDRDLDQGAVPANPDDPSDVQLWSNKRLGEAVIKITRLELSASPRYSFRAINQPGVSYREDEHHQPSVVLNNTNGQLITSWGARNSARDPVTGENVSSTNYIMYGQDTKTLGVPESIEYESTADYATMFFVGNTNYLFQRENVGAWHFSRGTGGQNYQNPVQFFDPETEELEGQYYFGISFVNRQLDADPQSAVDRSLVHFFGQPHPTANPDTTLRYCQGEFILAGQESSPYEGGGLFLKNVSDGDPVTGTNGRLDATFIAATASDIDAVYTAPVGSSVRLLDVQYDTVPRCLFVEFVFDWVHGDPVPYGKTYDLKLAQWNGSSWDVSTLKAGLLGGLGYKPTQVHTLQDSSTQVGSESYSSFYVLGASFYRGKDATDVEPIVYLCHRDGQNLDQYKLDELTLNAGYTAVSSEQTLVGPTNKILYRPEMTLYGDKRVLWYNEGDGWSSFNSWVAKTKWLDLTV